MKCSILSILKDNKGEYWSHNFQFVIWNILLMIGFIAVVSCSCISAMTDSPNTSGIITSLCANYTLISSPILGVVGFTKIKAQQILNEKEEKEQENVQSANA
jgi:hypothetical protein